MRNDRFLSDPDVNSQFRHTVYARIFRNDKTMKYF